MEKWEYRTLDVFTDRPFAGNQLAVFPDAEVIPEPALKRLAREIAFSETVFLLPPRQAGNARIRIFTPMSEIPFAGHPVLGAAILVADRLGISKVTLESGRGDIQIDVQAGSGNAALGTMVQPIPSIAPFAPVDALLGALGIARSLLPGTVYSNGISHVYVMVDDQETVAGLQPDYGALSEIAHEQALGAFGFNVFAGSGTTWKTRMFAPAEGIIEDPATGSAAGPLALHLARHGLNPWDTEITISQGAEVGRPSTLFARATLVENKVGRIEVGGHAVAIGGGWFDAALIRASLLPSSDA